MKQTKILGLTMILLFSALILRGQGWVKNYGNLRTYASVLSRDNGFVTVGSTSTGLNDTLIPLSVMKADSNGNLVWKRDFSAIDVGGFSLWASSDVFHIIRGNDNGYIISISGEHSTVTHLLKLDEAGNRVWLRQLPVWDNGALKILIGNKTKTNYFFHSNYQMFRIANNGDLIRRDSVIVPIRAEILALELAPANSAADFVGVGFTDTINTPRNSKLLEIYPNDSLKVLPVSTPITSVLGAFPIFRKMADGSYLAINNSGRAAAERYRESNGGYINLFTTASLVFSTITHISPSADTGFVACGLRQGIVPEVMKFDKQGTLKWRKDIFSSLWDNYNHSVLTTEDNKYILGYIISSTHIKIADDGTIFPAKLFGRITNDQNANCQIDANEPPFRGQTIVSAYKSTTNETYYGNIDSTGKYLFDLDTGRFTVNLVMPFNNYWANCTPSVSKTLLNVSAIDTLDFTLKPVVNCPLMQVDISNRNLRRCFENIFHVKYCNQGTITAQNARIEVKLDSLLEYVSATRPLSNRTGQTLIFNLGNVASLDCGNFSITARVRCGDSTRLRQTLCTEAHIYPDTICNPPANWSGANVVVSGRCDRDSVRFLIKNTTGVPTSSLRSIVVEDEIVFFNGTNNIPANATQTITLPANGNTWRLNQQQEPNNPRNALVTAVVEGCRVGTNGFSTGFVNDFPNNSGDPSVSTSCLPIVGSYDPNEKLAFPEGFKTSHFIEQNTPIDYQIGFQNTGTDTAFTVILRDTLDKSLDIATLNMGASSHAFTWELVGKNVLTISFDNIKLVDSFRNEVASHGFVKFRINQKKDVSLGTIINNQAAIYFDFNRPIFTNTTFHTVGKNVLRVSVESVVDKKTTIKVSPNPFSEHTTFELDPSVKTGIFELFDVNGRLLRRETFDNNRFEFQKRDLPTGIFIFKISTVDGRLIGHGKVVAQ